MVKTAKSLVAGLAALAVVGGISGCMELDGTAPSEVTTVTSVAAAVTPKSGTAGWSTPRSYDFTGVITVSGPTTVSYRWERSTGELEPIQQLAFDGAQSLAVAHSWSMSFCTGEARERWARLVVISPNAIESGRATFTHGCVSLLETV
jgi:hypothetical protein